MLEPISVNEFVLRTKIEVCRDLEHSWGSAKQVVSLRELKKVIAVQAMPTEYLEKILRNAIIASGNKERVYENCQFHTLKVSPQAVRIGQRFVLRSKYVSILENFGSILQNFTGLNIASAGSLIILGETGDGVRSVAHYVPPIAEMNGNSKWTLLDGIHRNFLINAVDGITPMIGIEGVKIPFPCSLHNWSDIRVTEEKPPKEERYFDLKPELFRRLEYVGIDG